MNLKLYVLSVILSVVLGDLIFSRIENTRRYYKIDKEMSICAMEIIETYFYRPQHVAIVMAYGDKSKRCLVDDTSKFQEIVNYLVHYISDVACITISCDVQNYTQHCENFVIVTESAESFRDNLDLIPPEHFSYSGRIMIIVKSDLNQRDDVMRIIQSILDESWALKMINVLLMMYVDGQITLYTFFPYTENNCNNSYAVEVNKWINESLQSNVNLYPRKVLQMNGCPVRVTAIERYPHVIMTTLGNGTILLDGIEAELINVLSKLLNFTLIIKTPIDGSVWGRWNETKWTGATGDLVYDRADLGIGAYYPSLMRVEVLDLSNGYDTIEIVWTIPRLELKSSALKMTLPFEYIVWICTLSTVFLIPIILYFLKTRIRNRSVQIKQLGLSIWQITLGLSLKFMPTGRFVCYIFTLWIWMSMVLRNIYQGSLVGFLTQTYYDYSIETMADLIDRKFTFYGTPQVVDIMKNVTDNEYVKIIFKQLNVISTDSEYDAISGRIASGEIFGALLHFRTRVPELNYKFQGHGALVVLKETYRSQIVTMACVKYGPMIEGVNWYINRICEAGLMDKWTEDFQWPPVVISKKPIIIQLYHLSGPFFLLIFGELVAVLVFMCEILYSRN